MGSPAAPTGILVRTKFFPLSFLLFFFKPRVCLDGGPPDKRTWGETFLSVAPGRHAVRCYVPYLYLRHMGDSTIEVDVAPGTVVAVQWRAPLLVLLAGRWTHVETPQGPPPA
jgi:hypothetical protein